MATFLDVSLLGGAKVIFTFLLVYVVVWGLLTWIKPFGKSASTGPYAIIALVAAFFSVISGTVRYIIEFMTPWFLFLILFLFFTLFIIRMFNVGEGDLKKIIGNGTVQVLIIAMILIIMFFALGSAFGQKSLEATQGGNVYYNPDIGTGATGGQPAGQPGSGGVLQPTSYPPGTLQPGDDIMPPQPTGGAQLQPGQPGATATPDFSLHVVNTLLHPKVLAIIAVLLIAVFTVWLLGRPDFI
ncbi:hypothetical protein GOV07_04825 [Candidatus Woesearchaeota archaeon]|nr:hypothetical protein [Candidatus Woesearchaeota archaeon]